MNNTEDEKLIIRRKVEVQLQQKQKPQILVTQKNSLDSITPSYRKTSAQQPSGTNLSPKELYDGSPSDEISDQDQFLSPEELYNSSPDGDGQEDGSAEPTFGQGIGGNNQDDKKDGRSEETKELEENALRGDDQHANENPENAGYQDSLPTESNEEAPQKPADAASKTPDSAPTTDKKKLEKSNLKDKAKDSWNKTKGKTKDITSKGRQVVSKGAQATKQGAQAAAQATKAAAQAVAQGARAAAVAIGEFVAGISAPAWGWIILIVAVVAGIAILIFFFRHNDPGTGKTITEATSPITDKNWIQKLRLYAGDKNVTKEMKDQLVKDLTEALTQIASDPDVKKADQDTATALLSQVSLLSSSSDMSIFTQKIKPAIDDFLKKYNSCSQIVSDTSFFTVMKDNDKTGMPLGYIKRSSSRPATEGDPDPVPVNQNMCRFLLYIRDNKAAAGVSHLTLTSVVGTHSREKTRGGKSAPHGHWMGNGVDLGEHSATLQTWIFNNRQTFFKDFGLHQAIGPNGSQEVNDGNYFDFGSATVGQHQTHIHLGFLD